MIIKSLLDTDFYKFTMGQIAYHKKPNLAEYLFINRSKIPLDSVIKEIEKEIKLFQELKITEEEIDYLRSLNFFKEDYLSFLKTMDLKSVSVEVSANEIRVIGPWETAIYFEVPILSIIQEVYWKHINPEFRGREILSEKIKLIENKDINIIDFGSRRRFSLNWHREVFSTLLDKKLITGSSNVLFSMERGLKPVGTMAHEFFQAHQTMTTLEESQVQALISWKQEYQDNLDVALTDTFTSDKFIEDYLRSGTIFKGFRHDSGDPVIWANKIRKMSPNSKLVFSDGLDFGKALELNKLFPGSVFGIGTYLTNDVGVKPLSLVMKLVKLNGKPTIKHSDEPGKIISESPELIEKTKKWLRS